ncbi:hydroquinone glucosyltransferase-like [Senna tora]|uniref:Hydroquinone glucosyltransferase-like n=1 Tax=Senna tora TaxID=362788 RepID=A0A834XGQ0_9FABA|nr:hydroquinone glucosyltransferase-like [Senna tora]
MERKTPSIAMVPCPGTSHLITQIEFAKRFVGLHPDFHVTLLIPTLGPPSPSMNSILQSLPPSIHFTVLPQVDPHDLPPNADPASLMLLTVTHSLPSLSQALSSLISQTHLVALVLNTFSVDAIEVAREFDLPCYVYYPSSATALAFVLHYPKLDDDGIVVSRKFGELELKEPLKIPGCIPFEARDLTDIVPDTSHSFHTTLVQVSKQLHRVDGILVNSFVDLEPGPISALQNVRPVYPVGPIVQTESNISSNSSECLAWLDKQPENSVLFVSFGSGGTLSQEQLNELAYGLELSGHRFLWVVRAPSKGGADSSYLNAQKYDDPLEHLPEGFMDRTKDQGFVISSWAPQIEVLRHGSTRGFLTHCGWNSTLESVVCGKSMIAWPLFAEQRMNAALLNDQFKVALRPKVNEKGIVEREEVSRVVKCLMEGDEGKEMGRRVEMFKDAAIKALDKDGSSTEALENVVTKWKNLKS